MTIFDLKKAIQDNIEWLETTEWGEEVECISIENLEYILSDYFKTEIKLSRNGE